MSKQNAQDAFAERVAAELIEQLKQGTAPFQKPWTPEMGSDLPYNYSTGNHYRGGNALALMIQPHNDPRWMTYKQAQAVGAQVRKGEKGTQLVKLVTHVERNAKDGNGKVIRDAEGQPVKERGRLENPYLKSFTVFNAEQIDGLSAYEPKQAKVFTDHERSERLLKASGANIEHYPRDQAFYAPGPDKIILPLKEQFTNEGSYYATALHELGHWTGHESRLNRELMNEYGTPKYAREELRAEISSLMLTRELGLPHDPEQHAAYVGGWVAALESDPLEILRASRDAVKIKDFIMAFDRQIEQEKAPEPVAAVEQEKPITEPVIPEPPNQDTPQTVEERFQMAKERYLMQTTLMTPVEQQTRRVLEHSMEKVVAGLSPEMQALARTNFYENQLKQSVMPDIEPSQSDLLFER